jgi:hypothetical protein
VCSSDLAKARGASVKDGQEISMSEIMKATTGDNGKYILKSLSGWELENELNESNTDRLANEYPGAAISIMDAYRLACTEGRLGN